MILKSLMMDETETTAHIRNQIRTHIAIQELRDKLEQKEKFYTEFVTYKENELSQLEYQIKIANSEFDRNKTKTNFDKLMYITPYQKRSYLREIELIKLDILDLEDSLDVISE